VATSAERSNSAPRGEAPNDPGTVATGATPLRERQSKLATDPRWPRIQPRRKLTRHRLKPSFTPLARRIYCARRARSQLRR
jgi:hypothetical protein